MNPIRRRRLLWVLLLLVAAGMAATLVAMALQRNATYLYTPSEVLRGEAGAPTDSGQARFRLGGMVEKGSLQRAPGSMEAHFRVTDGDAQLPVVYSGILPDLFREDQAVVGGDARCLSIAAASIIAKVTRDRIMTALAADHPGYGWAANKGYGTAEHSAALDRLGVTIHHRRSYAPVARRLAGA